jgi:2,4-dienoyl-CoA reductase-like NADH-dependent reductase (Old Yellow Enzyme family)/thioredoxin reductase
MARHANLFEPIKVGPVTIPNRIVRSAHGTLLTGESLIAYHEARARGGVGMSTMEATSVHPRAPSILPLYSDACLPFYEEISRRVHAHGMKLFQQLYHPGASHPGVGPQPETWSCSAIPNVMTGIVPIAMTKAMIDDVVQCFADAAVRCRDAGLDGVDIHASSGYLIHEFLSPALNHRTDEYGGSPENRMRFLIEVINAVRSAVGDAEFAVGVRLPNEDHVPGGLVAAENARIAQAVEPLVDYVSLHMGAYWRFHTLIAPSDAPLGAEMDANRVITRAVSKPTIVVGRIMTLDHASAIVASGEGDMVSMVRALIADPGLVNKARDGQEHRVRPCIGTNMGCVGQLMSSGVLGCVVNIAAAREDRISFEPDGKASYVKKVLVVGGGPAGLEAARTAALRGHAVELHEATSRLGGQVRLAAQAPHRADVGAITSWLTEEIESLGVVVHFNSMVDADMIARIAADEVIIATGTTPRTDGFQVSTPARPIPGHDLPHVLDSWRLFGVGAKPDLRGPAVVFDDTGTFEAISAADVLLKAGLSVTLVARTQQLGENVPFPPSTVEAARERLMSGNFEFIGGHYLREITGNDVEIGVLFTDRSRRIGANTVVLVGFNEPNRDLAETLTEAGVPHHLIGDARGRNSIMTAIHDGANLGRTI